MGLPEMVRLSARVSAALGVTGAMYTVHELRSALAPREQRQTILESYSKVYVDRILRLFGVEYRVVGAGSEHLPLRGVDERGIGRVFIANHRSALDILLTVALAEGAHVSRADLSRWPVIGTVARRVGTLFVDRESRRSGQAVLFAMCTALREGRGLLIFPEGTTFDGDEVRPLKPGAFMAAKRCDAEIVPIGVAYESGGAAFGDESFPEHIKRVVGTPKTRVAAVVGDPWRPGDAEIAETSARARTTLQSLVTEARTRIDGWTSGSTP